MSLLAADYPVGSDIKGGYPEFTIAVLKKLGWDSELTTDEMTVINKIGGGDETRSNRWLAEEDAKQQGAAGPTALPHSAE